MKKLIVAFLAVVSTTPVVSAGLFSVTKEVLKSAVLGLQMYGSYRLLNQSSALRLGVACLVHIPWFYCTQKAFNVIHNTTLTNQEFKINWEDCQIESKEQLLPFLTYTFGLAAIIRQVKANTLNSSLLLPKS